MTDNSAMASFIGKPDTGLATMHEIKRAVDSINAPMLQATFMPRGWLASTCWSWRDGKCGKRRKQSSTSRQDRMIKTTGLTGGFDYEYVKEPVYSRSYGKEDTVKETQEGCLSRPIRIKSELFESSDFQADWQKYFFDSLRGRSFLRPCTTMPNCGQPL